MADRTGWVVVGVGEPSASRRGTRVGLLILRVGLRMDEVAA